MNPSTQILEGSPGWDLKVENVLLRVFSNTASGEHRELVQDARFVMRCVVRRPRDWAPLFALAKRHTRFP